jgi:hypothetical protein
MYYKKNTYTPIRKFISCKKKRKKKYIVQHGICANPPQPSALPSGGGYAQTQPFSATKKKAPFFD